MQFSGYGIFDDMVPQKQHLDEIHKLNLEQITVAFRKIPELTPKDLFELNAKGEFDKATEELQKQIEYYVWLSSEDSEYEKLFEYDDPIAELKSKYAIIEGLLKVAYIKDISSHYLNYSFLTEYDIPEDIVKDILNDPKYSVLFQKLRPPIIIIKVHRHNAYQLEA